MSDTVNGTNQLPDVYALEKLANQLFSAIPSRGSHDVNSANVPNFATTSEQAINQGNAVDLLDPQTSLPDANNLGLGHVPTSAHTVSGVSPGAKQLNSFPFENDRSFEKELNKAIALVTPYSPSPQLPFTPSGNLGEHSYYFSSPYQFVKELSASHYGNGKNTGTLHPSFNVNVVRNDFPILSEIVDGKPLIWLDNAATTQKPQQVIERLAHFYKHENSNIHRAAHQLAARATDAYEDARQTVQQFINAKSINEIVFVRGTTEAINLVAASWGEQYLQQDDEIVISHLEHHANIVPWQLLAKKKGLQIRIIPVDDHGQIILDEYAKLLGPKTKLVSFTLVSNALGTVTPAKAIVDLAHAVGAKVLADGAQSVSHIKTDVQVLNADWFVFSGHKIFGPTGIGVLYGKEELLNATQPYQGGGNMIKDVTFEHTQFNAAPSLFEAGTGNIADAVGLGEAIKYVEKIGISNIYQYEHFLLSYATNLLKQIPGLRLIGTAADKTSVLSFVLQGFTTTEVGDALSKQGIAVRSGHHCAQPILRRFGVEATVRPSIAFYNTCAELDKLAETVGSLKAGKKVFF